MSPEHNKRKQLFREVFVLNPQGQEALRELMRCVAYGKNLPATPGLSYEQGRQSVIGTIFDLADINLLKINFTSAITEKKDSNFDNLAIME